MTIVCGWDSDSGEVVIGEGIVGDIVDDEVEDAVEALRSFTGSVGGRAEGEEEEEEDAFEEEVEVPEEVGGLKLLETETCGCSCIGDRRRGDLARFSGGGGAFFSDFRSCLRVPARPLTTRPVLSLFDLGKVNDDNEEDMEDDPSLESESTRISSRLSEEPHRSSTEADPPPHFLAPASLLTRMRGPLVFSSLRLRVVGKADFEASWADFVKPAKECDDDVGVVAVAVAKAVGGVK